MHQEDNAGKANVSLAAFYAVSAGLFGWVAGCLAVLLLIVLIRFPIFSLYRMFSYHIGYFYLYLAIFSIVYGIFLFLRLLYHPGSKWKSLCVSVLGIAGIVSVSSIPCGMLYQLQDMLEGFYPDDIWTMLVRDLSGCLSVGWQIVLLSFPLNLAALIGFFVVTRFCVKRYERGCRPWLYRKLAKWNAAYPDRVFFAAGAILFIIALGCCTSHIDYEYDRYFLGSIYIPRIRPFGWFILGMIVPIVEGQALVWTFFCWLFKFINRKLAWTVLVAASLSMAVTGIWNMLPQNVFIRTLGPAYDKSMRLRTLSVMDSFNDGITTAGTFDCEGDLLAELRADRGMNADNEIAAGPFVLKITPLGNRLYEFRYSPVFRPR